MEMLRWFDAIRLGDTASVGGKGANLGELTFGGLPVPPGFVVTSDAYRYALASAGVADKLAEVVGEADAANPAELAAAAQSAQDLIRTVVLPHDLATAVIEAYHRLGSNVIVAVRSSGTSEDRRATSFAGMNATFTNVAGDDELLARVVDCWASLYGERVISYRAQPTASGDEPAHGRGRPADGRRRSARA